MKLRYTEKFFSLQGEGLNVGVPSLFLRTFGCNFRCPLFGLPHNTKLIKHTNPEVEKLLAAGVVENHSKYDDLPLVSTGCDTYASIYPQFKKFAKENTAEQLVELFRKDLPGGRFSLDKHLILTGGEPLLAGWQKFWPELIERCVVDLGLTDLTFETNGTQPLTPQFLAELNRIIWVTGLRVLFSVSAKLPVSGESWENAIKPNIVKTYLAVEGANTRSYFKFVVASQKDVEDAQQAKDQYFSEGVILPVYLMAVGGVTDVYEMNDKKVADFCRDNGFRYSPRLQIPLYGNAWAT